MSKLQCCCQFWKRQASNNDEGPLNKISKIMEMRPISIQKHEWIFANVDQTINLSQGIHAK